MTTPTTAPVRRWIVRVTIGSFSVAALLGIAALLSGGEFGQTQGQVLLTTLLVGVVSIAVLCYLTTAGRRTQPVGVTGGAVVLVPLATGLTMIWSSFEQDPGEWWVKTFAIGAIVAATLAQICLLLAPRRPSGSVAGRILTATVGLAALLAGMTSLLVLGVHPGDDGYYRAVGVVAILDVLGTVVGAALLKFGPGTANDRGPGGLALSLPADVAQALLEEASRARRTPDEVAAGILRAHLTPRQDPQQQDQQDPLDQQDPEDQPVPQLPG
jgi:hypothetical protein